MASPAPYLQSAAAKVGVAAPGLLLRTNLAVLPGALAFVGAHGWNSADVDLLIEVGHIAEFDPTTLAGYISQAISGQIAAGVWRSVTLSSSSAPKDFGGLPAGVNIVPRKDWLLWHAIAQLPNLPIDYSDFGVSHLDLAEPPGFVMAKATVSVRYTALNHWIMIKGRATTGPNGIAMSAQYLAHAQALVGRQEFNRVQPCWADMRIRAIASGASTPGGRAQWVEINTNRHLTFVAEYLP